LKKQIILIDYENVQPTEIALANDSNIEVTVFLGAAQRLTPEFANQCQMLGKNLRYIQISGTGPNALDFHIAYYIGVLAAKSPGAIFHIISKDTGFNPLIRHLEENGIICYRSSNFRRISRIAKEEVLEDLIEEMPNSSDALSAGILQKVADKIRKLHTSKPTRRKSLIGTITNYLKPVKVTEIELERVVDHLVTSGVLQISPQGKVSYPNGAVLESENLRNGEGRPSRTSILHGE
jgi:hypothetical protein